MTRKKQIYKCLICGNLVEVLHSGGGELVCCGEPMKLIKEKNQDEGKEKHVPIVEKTDEGILVKVGSESHPMEEEHYIEWIELNIDGKSYKAFLSPTDNPQALFGKIEGSFSARIYCNIHGLWSN